MKKELTQVPALIKHPSTLPELATTAFKNPDPENAALVPVLVEVGDVLVFVAVPVAVVVGTAVPVLVAYFTPLAGQSDVSPTNYGIRY